jgi:hypothetical protein
VKHLEGSHEAKERLQVILQTLTGECRVQEACAKLAISEQRVHQLRTQALQAAVDRLEARPGGRPAHTRSAAEEQVAQLQAQVQELEVELQLMQVREEISLAMPRLVHETEAAPKKAQRRRIPR